MILIYCKWGITLIMMLQPSHTYTNKKLLTRRATPANFKPCLWTISNLDAERKKCEGKHTRVSCPQKLATAPSLLSSSSGRRREKTWNKLRFLVNDWYSIAHCVSLILDSRYTWHEGGVDIQYSSCKLCRFIYFFCSVYICFLSVIYHFDLPFSLSHFSYRSCNQIEVTVSVIYASCLCNVWGWRRSIPSVSSFFLSLSSWDCHLIYVCHTVCQSHHRQHPCVGNLRVCHEAHRDSAKEQNFSGKEVVESGLSLSLFLCLSLSLNFSDKRQRQTKNKRASQTMKDWTLEKKSTLLTRLEKKRDLFLLFTSFIVCSSLLLFPQTLCSGVFFFFFPFPLLTRGQQKRFSFEINARKKEKKVKGKPGRNTTSVCIFYEFFQEAGKRARKQMSLVDKIVCLLWFWRRWTTRKMDREVITKSTHFVWSISFS